MNPTKIAIHTFIRIKDILDKIEKQNTLKEKLRTRSRNIPEMIADLGLVPALSFCLSKAGIKNLTKVLRVISSGDPKEILENRDKIGEEELSYALYVYVILKYLSDNLGTLKVEDKKIKLDLDKLKDDSVNALYDYLYALMHGANSVIAINLLQPYLTQFKRLCEATFPAEKR